MSVAICWLRFGFNIATFCRQWLHTMTCATKAAQTRRIKATSVQHHAEAGYAASRAPNHSGKRRAVCMQIGSLVFVQKGVK